MTTHRADHFTRAHQTASEWLDTVADQLGTEDRNDAYRLLRAWLRTVRDRLGVDSAAHFAAQLPLVLRGLYFDGWNPSQVPVKYDAEQFLVAIAQEARVSLDEARMAAAAVTAALAQHCTPGQIGHLLAQLPVPIRELLEPAEPPAVPERALRSGGRHPSEERIGRLERDLAVVVQALGALAGGLADDGPGGGDQAGVRAAARRARDIIHAAAPAAG